MCGIFGYVAWDRPLPQRDHLCRVTNLLRHRGPDGGGWWQEHGAFLGHRRLAILDLSSGDQPMASSDGRYVITFNGEIYNYPELREELRAAGARFRTASDTEVILEGYACWGTDVVARLEGMFAFGLYDRQARTLLLARDRFGEKPLLVTQRDGAVLFSSELGPIASLAAGPSIDREALAGYLCLNYVPGGRTMLEGVERLPPGHWRLIGPDAVQQRPYADATASAALPPGGDEALLDALQERIDRAVQLTLRSDVPVGLFLSGGVDSSIVAQSAARQGRLEAAYCVDFTTHGFSEWDGASDVAARLGIDIVRVPLDASVLDEFVQVAGHLDDPLADSSAMAVWTVSRAAARRMKVVLSGDGGDELFGGYLTYPASRWHRRLRAVLPQPAASLLAGAAGALRVDDRVKVGLTDKAQRFLRALPLDTRIAHFTWNGTWLPADAAALASDASLRDSTRHALDRVAERQRLGAAPSLRDLQAADIREYLANDILAKVDRSAMAHGLESRAPLLNPSVAALALALPERLRVAANGTTKVLLRRLCARHFGQARAFAPKQGFSIPVHRWLRREGRTLMTDLLQPERVAALQLLDPAAVARVVDEHLSGRRAHGWELWGLMVLIAWFEQRVSAPPRPSALPAATDLVAMEPCAAR